MEWLAADATDWRADGDTKKREFRKNFNPIQCGFIVEIFLARVRVQPTVFYEIVFIRKFSLREALEEEKQKRNYSRIQLENEHPRIASSSVPLTPHPRKQI